MREAGVNLVTVGVFSWALLEPAEGEYDFGVAGPGARAAARRRHPRRPRDPDRGAAGVVLARHPEALPVDRSRASRSGSAPRVVLPQLGRLPAAAARIAERAGRALRRPPGAGAVARPQRVRRARRRLLLRRPARRRSAAGCASATATSTRSTTRGAPRFWGQRYGDWDEIDRAAARADAGQPGPAAGLPALRLGRAPRVTSGASATSCAGCRPDVPVTTNFMVDHLHVHRLLALGRRGRRRRQRPLPDRRGPPTTTSSWRWPPT